MRQCLLCAALAVALAAPAACLGQPADLARIDTYGAQPFVYGGYAYVPLRSAADYLGAGLLWDSLNREAIITYQGREVGLVVGRPSVEYQGAAVPLPVPPLLVGTTTYVPATVLDQYLGVPIRYEGKKQRLLVQGPRGWGAYRVVPHAPPGIAVYLRGQGPPPWAPAHGRRRNRAPYRTIYAPGAFVYYGATYVPLRDIAAFVGATLLWDQLHNRSVLVYNGREIGLVIGSRAVAVGGRELFLPAPPLLVGNTVFVPLDLFERELSLPTVRSAGEIEFRHADRVLVIRVKPAPPGRIAARSGELRGPAGRRSMPPGARERTPPGRGGKERPAPGRGGGRGRGRK